MMCFDATDFIEFYGAENDGWIDSVFYKGRFQSTQLVHAVF